jgi:hypothetical protein
LSWFSESRSIKPSPTNKNSEGAKKITLSIVDVRLNKERQSVGLPSYLESITSSCTTITLSKDYPDKNKNQHCAEASAAQFFSTIAGNDCSEKIIHREVV